MLNTPSPNCAMQTTPQPNWPMAMMPHATTGLRLGRNLKEICKRGSPATASLDLYSQPQPSHDSRAGYGAPQCGQANACSEISRRHSRQGFTDGPLTFALSGAHGATTRCDASRRRG